MEQGNPCGGARPHRVRVKRPGLSGRREELHGRRSDRLSPALPNGLATGILTTSPSRGVGSSWSRSEITRPSSGSARCGGGTEILSRRLITSLFGAGLALEGSHLLGDPAPVEGSRLWCDQLIVQVSRVDAPGVEGDVTTQVLVAGVGLRGSASRLRCRRPRRGDRRRCPSIHIRFRCPERRSEPPRGCLPPAGRRPSVGWRSPGPAGRCCSPAIVSAEHDSARLLA